MKIFADDWTRRVKLMASDSDDDEFNDDDEDEYDGFHEDEEFDDFDDDFDDEFVENEERWTENVSRYVDDHIGQFVKIL